MNLSAVTGQLDGDTVAAIDVGAGVVIAAAGGIRLAIDTEFTLSTGASRSRFLASSGVDAAVLEEMLVGKAVRSVQVDVDGRLSAVIGGTVLAVAPDGDREAWTLRDRSGFLAGAMPGGGVAVWTAPARAIRVDAPR